MEAAVGVLVGLSCVQNGTQKLQGVDAEVIYKGKTTPSAGVHGGAGIWCPSVMRDRDPSILSSLLSPAGLFA